MVVGGRARGFRAERRRQASAHEAEAPPKTADAEMGDRSWRLPWRLGRTHWRAALIGVGLLVPCAPFVSAMPLGVDAGFVPLERLAVQGVTEPARVGDAEYVFVANEAVQDAVFRWKQSRLIHEPRNSVAEDQRALPLSLNRVVRLVLKLSDRIVIERPLSNFRWRSPLVFEEYVYRYFSIPLAKVRVPEEDIGSQAPIGEKQRNKRCHQRNSLNQSLIFRPRCFDPLSAKSGLLFAAWLLTIGCIAFGVFKLFSYGPRRWRFQGGLSLVAGLIGLGCLLRWLL